MKARENTAAHKSAIDKSDERNISPEKGNRIGNLLQRKQRPIWWENWIRVDQIYWPRQKTHGPSFRTQFPWGASTSLKRWSSYIRFPSRNIEPVFLIETFNKKDAIIRKQVSGETSCEIIPLAHLELSCQC